MYDDATFSFPTDLNYDELGYIIEGLKLRLEQAPAGSAEELCIEELILKFVG